MPNLVHVPEKKPKPIAPMDPVAAVKRRLLDLVEDEECNQRLARLDTKNLNEFGYDPFGYNPKVLRNVMPTLKWLHRYYFRTQVFGIENVPATGRCLFIANHSGQLPVDGLVIGSSIFFDTEHPRVVRAMTERFIPRVPWLSTFFARCGQILGAPDNCERMLENDEAVLVFPEGARGISKPPNQAYKLTEFGNGFLRLAIRTGTPIVPIAVIGGEEQYIRVANMKPLARLMNLPAAPLFLFGVAPVPGGLLPLPVRYRLHFGSPMVFEGDPDEDELVIGTKVKAVKSTIQNMLQRGLAERKNVFW